MTRIGPSSFINSMVALSRALNARATNSLPTTHVPSTVVAIPTETLRTPVELLRAAAQVAQNQTPALGLGGGEANVNDLDAPVPMLPEDAPMMDFSNLDGDDLGATGAGLTLVADETVPASGRGGPHGTPLSRVDPELAMRVSPGALEDSDPTNDDPMPSVGVAPPGSSSSSAPTPAIMVAPPGTPPPPPEVESPSPPLGSGSSNLSASTQMPALAGALLGRVSSS